METSLPMLIWLLWLLKVALNGLLPIVISHASPDSNGAILLNSKRPRFHSDSISAAGEHQAETAAPVNRYIFDSAIVAGYEHPGQV